MQYPNKVVVLQVKIHQKTRNQKYVTFIFEADTRKKTKEL